MSNNQKSGQSTYREPDKGSQLPSGSKMPPPQPTNNDK